MNDKAQTATLTGGCMCGAVRYAASWPPNWSAHCHCRDCQRATGAAFATYSGIRKDGFRWSKGEPKIFRSSPGVERYFCGDCGTSLAYWGERWPDEVHIFTATLDEPARAEPQLHIYTSEQLPWIHLGDGLPQRLKTSR